LVLFNNAGAETHTAEVTTEYSRVPGNCLLSAVTTVRDKLNSDICWWLHSLVIHGHVGLNLSELHYAETSGTSHAVVLRHILEVRRPLRVTVLVTTCCTPDNIKLDLMR